MPEYILYNITQRKEHSYATEQAMRHDMPEYLAVGDDYEIVELGGQPNGAGRLIEVGRYWRPGAAPRLSKR